jgi:hypothetical protein
MRVWRTLTQGVLTILLRHQSRGAAAWRTCIAERSGFITRSSSSSTLTLKKASSLPPASSGTTYGSLPSAHNRRHSGAAQPDTQSAQCCGTSLGTGCCQHHPAQHAGSLPSAHTVQQQQQPDTAVSQTQHAQQAGRCPYVQLSSRQNG